MGALDGFRIRIVSDGVAGQYAGWLLAGIGAEVEYLHARPASSMRAVERWLTSGTQRRALTKYVPLAELANGCDALLVDFGEQLESARAREFESLERSHPDAVCLALSPFGLTGPLAGRRAGPQEIQALSGLLHATGDPDHPPSPVAGRVVEMTCGVNSANAILVGLLRRIRFGVGSLVDIAALETIVCLQSSRILAYAYTGLVYRRNNDANMNNFLRCKDGWLQATIWAHPFEQAMEFFGIGAGELSSEVLGLVDQGQKFAHPELMRVVRQKLAAHTRDEWTERSKALRIPIVPVLSAGDIVRDRHLEARGFWKSFTLDGRTIRVPGYPFRSPVWGEAVSGAKLPAAATARDATRLPLAGLRVTEVGLAWSGPMAAETFAQLGAEVVKLESPTRLDTARSLPLMDLEMKAPWWEYTYNYHPVNAGKRHFGFNVNGPSAKEVGRRLLERTDMVFTNYSVRALKNLGLDGESIRRINPRCSVAHSTGFGWDGPYRDLVAYGTGMEGMTGLALETGGKLGPIRSPLLHPDIFASLHQQFGGLAALVRREAMGEGTIIDLGQLECGSAAIFEEIAQAQGVDPGSKRPTMLLRAKGDDDWVSASPTSEAEAAIAQALAKGSESKSRDALAGELLAAGIAAAPVLSPDEVLQFEQLKARDYFVRVESDAFGPRLAVGRWHRFIGLPPAKLDGVHTFGLDNHSILRETLEFTPSEIAGILADGTVGPAPTDSPQPAAAASPVDWMVKTRQIYRWDADFRERLGLVRKT